jgi:uncharacterized protein involved in outer membrane biogenesis
MLKKLLKWSAIVVGGLLLVLVIGIVALPFVFPLEKIKQFAVARIGETIHREVKIDKVSFDIFSGIKLQGLAVSNRPGFAKQPFITADAIELRYAFWPLFSRQVIIKEISLVKPQILIEKNSRGEFNFSDLLTTQPPANASKPANHQGKLQGQPTTKPPFDLFVSSFSIKNAKLTLNDYSTGTVNEIKNFNLKVGGFELALVKPIDLAASAVVTYQGKEIPLSLGGQIGVGLAAETINLKNFTLSIAGESLAAAATVSGWTKAPRLTANISSGQINVDPLLAIFAGSTAKAPSAKLKPGELTKMVNGLTASLPRNVSANVNLDVANLTFQKFKVDKIEATVGLVNKVATVKLKGIKIYDGLLSGNLQANLNAPGLAYEVKDLRLAGFNASPFSNAVIETFLTGMPDYKELVNKVYGTLDVSTSLTGRGVEPDAIMTNLNLNGSLTLKNGELKRLKTLAEVGKTLKSTSLQQDIKFGALYTAFSFANRVVTAKALKVEETDFKLYFNGGADLKSLKWVSGNKLTLKLAPHLTKDLPREYSIFKDAKGWFELSFEMTGDLKKPFPKPILDKPLEVVTEKIKAKIEAKKVEIVESAKTEVATKAAEAKKELEEKAKGAIKDLLKF